MPAAGSHPAPPARSYAESGDSGGGVGGHAGGGTRQAGGPRPAGGPRQAGGLGQAGGSDVRAAAGAQVVDVDTVGCGIAAPTYAPAPMGTGLGWTDEERVALCKAYLSTSLDPVKGADQSGPTFWTSVVTAWKGLLSGRPDVRRRTESGVGGVQKQRDKIRKGVHEFGSHYLEVKRMELTGNPRDEDMISAAMARFCGANVYEAIRKDRTEDKAEGKATKRQAKQVHFPWVPFWRVLRQGDNCSGAAGAAAADGGAAGAGSAGGSPGGRSTSDSDEDAEDAVCRRLPVPPPWLQGR